MVTARNTVGYLQPVTLVLVETACSFPCNLTGVVSLFVFSFFSLSGISHQDFSSTLLSLPSSHSKGCSCCSLWSFNCPSAESSCSIPGVSGEMLPDAFTCSLRNFGTYAFCSFDLFLFAFLLFQLSFFLNPGNIAHVVCSSVSLSYSLVFFPLFFLSFDCLFQIY